MRYQLTLAYDGTAYSGWQVQTNGIAIQPLVQQALATVLRHPLDLTGAGRTDAGVHAKGQTAHFDSEVAFEPPKLLLSLNALLPPDIRLLRVESRGDDFHARYSAVGKTYHYHLHLARVADPFTAPYCYHVLERLDTTKLVEGARLFLGPRDFTSFANEAHRGSASRGAVRTLRRFDVVEQSGGVRLELEADGFLYKMVRNLVGSLIDLAAGRFTEEQIAEIFAAKDRRKAGTAAPAHGLFLMRVQYSLESGGSPQ